MLAILNQNAACILTAKQAQADIRKGTLSFKTHLTEPQGKIKNRYPRPT